MVCFEFENVTLDSWSFYGGECYPKITISLELPLISKSYYQPRLMEALPKLRVR